MPRIFDYFENRHKAFVLHSEVKTEKYKRFVKFIQTKYTEHEPIIPKKVVSIEDCPVKDEETARDYLDLMEKTGLHLKSKHTAVRKEYSLGCTPEEEAAFKRTGFEGWMGVKTEEFFQRRRLAGRFVLERVYRFREYGDPIFPAFAEIFPWASGVLTGRAGRCEEGSGTL